MTSTRETYLDHAASAPLLAEARDAVVSALGSGPGNPSSAHAAGRRLRRLLEDAREAVAELVSARPAQVIFTSGTTESNRLGLRGLLRANPERRLVTTDAAHDNLRALVAVLESDGADVVCVPVDRSGHIREHDIAPRVGTEQVVLALPVVESVTGALQPVEAIAHLHPDALIHADAAQAVGRIPTSFPGLGAATMSFSAHKLGGPQGIGALIVRDDAQWAAPDGVAAQERGRRAGTEAVALACGFGAAARIAGRTRNSCSAATIDALAPLRAFVARDPDAEMITAPPAAPGIVLVRFRGCPGDAVLVALDAVGIRVSTGTACASGARVPPHVLVAGGHAPDAAARCVRVSIGRGSSVDDAVRLVAALRVALPRVRSALGSAPTLAEKKFTRKSPDQHETSR